MSKDEMQTFAELVRAWRQAQARGIGITRAEAARRLKIPYRTIEEWEHARHAPRGLALRLITARLRRR